MSNIAAERNLAIVAGEINTIKQQTKIIVLQASCEIGKRLVEAKAMVGHGNWETWLKQSVDYSQRTASNMIKIFQEYGTGQQKLFEKVSNSQALADLTYTQAVALLGIKNPDEREEFAEKNNLKEMTTRELQQAIKERDQAKEELETTSDDLKKAKEKLIEEINNKTDLIHKAEEIRDDKEKLEKEIEDLRSEKAKVEQKAADLEEKIKTTPTESKNSDKTEKLEAKLGKMNDKISSLKAKLKEAEEQRQLNIDKVPEETQKAMQSLRQQLQEAKDNPREQAVLKYRIYFENIKEDFGRLLESLAEIEEGEIKEKYRSATVKALEILKSKIAQG